MVKKILVVLAIILLVFPTVVYFQPDTYRIERSTVIAASPAAVFAQVNDLHKWEDWSPWAKIDPAAKNSFSGAEAGEGAVFQWAGNDEVGEGKMTIVKSQPNELVDIRLDFVKPYEGTSNSEFTFQPDGDGTRVTWAMYGTNNFMAKAMCLFMNMDKMMGKYFEEGLANMKQVVEKAPAGEEPATEPPAEPAVESPAAKANEAEAPNLPEATPSDAPETMN